MRSLRRISLAVTTLAFIAVSLSCTGFFVNQPTSITVTTGADGGGSNSFTVQEGLSVKLFATGTYSNGNKDITSSATWQSSTPCATVTQGNVKGVGAITGVTITATLDGIAGSASGDVTGGGSGLVITSPTQTTFTNGTQATFTTTFNGTDVSTSTVWTSGNSSFVTFSGNTASFVGSGSTTITGSYVSGSICAGVSKTITIQ